MEGDETFYAVSRQSRVINAVATQSYNSLYSKCGSNGKEAVRVLLQNLRVKICLNGEDNETAKHVTELCGKVIKQRYSSFSQHSGLFKKDGGSKNKTTNMEEKPMFEEWDFYQLQTMVGRSADASYSEAIIFNGGAAPGDAISKKVRLKPIWLTGGEKDKNKKDWEAKRSVKRKFEQERAKDAAKGQFSGDPVPAPATPTNPSGMPQKPTALPETTSSGGGGGGMPYQFSYGWVGTYSLG